MVAEKINWRSGTPREAIAEYLLWREAVELADRGDNEPLISLFHSDHVLGPEARALVADLLSRYRLSRKVGKPATPAYRVTAVEGMLNDAAARYRYFKKTMPGDKALQCALRDQKREMLMLKTDREYSDAEIDGMIKPKEIEALANRIDGKRGSTRRMRKRAGK